VQGKADNHANTAKMYEKSKQEGSSKYRLTSAAERLKRRTILITYIFGFCGQSTGELLSMSLRTRNQAKNKSCANCEFEQDRHRMSL